MRKSRSRTYTRSWRASLRDTSLLLREFRDPLALFLLAIVGFGLLYYRLAAWCGEPLSGPVEGVFLVLSATFLESSGDFPQAFVLQLFHFLMPVIGVITLAYGLADFGTLFFNRRARGKEWEMAVASTFNNHIILVGLGHLGFRVASQLHDMEQDVVAVELSPTADLVANTRRLDIPVIPGDGTKEEMLEAAGIRRARTIILCTQNDSLNLQMAVKARGIRPSIHVVIRIFDDDFAAALQQQFGFQAISATGIASPVFAATAAGANITPPIMVEGIPLCFGTVAFPDGYNFRGKTLHDLEQLYRISIVFLKRQGGIEWHPSGFEKLRPGDIVGVLGKPDPINQIVHDCRDPQ
ncbi:MAG: TrkA family potassium uptake protein [Anaerolineales bacterium]|nr:TrkA family potassium uptake protein [Anaerolineales bacterium]